MTTGKGKGSLWRYWPRALLIIPFALVACVPFYNRIEPTLFSIPFFYWYQLAAILVGAGVVMSVYLLERNEKYGEKKREFKGGRDDHGGTGENL